MKKLTELETQFAVNEILSAANHLSRCALQGNWQEAGKAYAIIEKFCGGIKYGYDDSKTFSEWGREVLGLD